MGSFHLRSSQLSGLVSPMEDGGSVVPSQRPSGAGMERDPGEHNKPKGDSTCIGGPKGTPGGPEFEPNEERDFSYLLKYIKSVEKSFTGVNVPPKLIKLYKNCNHNKNGHVHDIFSIFYDPDVYDLSYQSLKSNPGNMTPGSDKSTLEGWNYSQTERIINNLRNGTFRFTPARLVEIPKQDGSKRKLLIAPPKDKIVQRIIAWILEAIYEPSFHKQSFGFRYGLGCHDALNYIRQSYKPVRYFIEGDISKCFDSIDHNILIMILRRRIKDEKFIQLIIKALKAGYLNMYKIPQDSIVGTPQGSIVSPILCNIFMNEFDSFINDIIPKYNRGLSRKQPADYKRALSSSNYYAKRYGSTRNPLYLEKARSFRKKALSLPSVTSNDDTYRRLVYCRYADDWLIGFAGPYKEAEEIRSLCKQFLETLKLDLNLNKTTVTKASEGCIFLGCKIHIPVNQQRYRLRISKNKLLQRASLGVRINAPILRIFKKLNASNICTIKGIPIPRMALFAEDKQEIVKNYVSILRGILGYYSMVDNYARLSYSLWYILRGSCCKVLAAKYKLKTVRQVLLKFGKYLNKDGSKGFPSVKDTLKIDFRGYYFKLGHQTDRVTSLTKSASFTLRIKDARCVMCESTYNVHMHHIRHIKDLNGNLDVVSRAMAARRRKQIPLCEHCHRNKHIMIRQIKMSSAKARFLKNMQ